MKTNTLKNYKEAIELIQYFTNRVENGTIRSRITYGKYKDFLNRIKQLEESQPEPAKLYHEANIRGIDWSKLRDNFEVELKSQGVEINSLEYSTSIDAINWLESEIEKQTKS